MNLYSIRVLTKLLNHVFDFQPKMTWRTLPSRSVTPVSLPLILIPPCVFKLHIRARTRLRTHSTRMTLTLWHQKHARHHTDAQGITLPVIDHQISNFPTAKPLADLGTLLMQDEREFQKKVLFITISRSCDYQGNESAGVTRARQQGCAFVIFWTPGCPNSGDTK